MVIVPDLWLTEEGDPWLAEDGSLLVLESDDGARTAVATVTLRQNRSTNAYYWIGDVPVFTATFVDLNGGATDPAIVVFTWRRFNGTESSYTFGTDNKVDSTGIGVYTFTAPELNQQGLHTCRVDGTDPTAAAERSIGVRQSRFANP